MRLSERAILVYLSLRVWSAEILDNEATTELASNNGADANSLRVVKSLMPKDWLNPLNTLKGSIRTAHYALTSPWLDNGYRIAASAMYPRYQQTMADYEPQWARCVESTLDTYQDARERGLQSQGRLAHGDDYPDATALRGRFVFSVRIRNVPDADDFRATLDEASMSYVKDCARRDERDTIARVQADAANRLRAALEHMKARITEYSSTDGKGKKLYESTVSNVRDLVDLVPLMDVSGDSNLASICAEVSMSLCRYGVDTLKTSAALRDETATKAAEILSRMKGYGF